MKPGEEDGRGEAGGGERGDENALLVAAVLPDNALDPLAHEEWDPFWKEVESYFQPLRESDVNFLKGLDSHGKSLEEFDQSLRVPPLNYLKRNDDWDTMSMSSDGKDGSQAGKRPKRKNGKEEDSEDADTSKEEVEDLQQSLNSYPYTHRLVAAFIDEGGGKAMSIPNVKVRGHAEDPAWLGPGEEGNLRSFQRALESRVTTELKSLGLINGEDEDTLQTDLRQAQWVLRDIKMTNKTRREALTTKVMKNGLKNQARAREIKRGNDELEIAYLERMIRKCKKNKRSKHYNKVLNSLFPHRKQQKKEVEEAKEEEPSSLPAKSAKKKSYNKKPVGTSSTKAAAKKKGTKSEDDDMIIAMDDTDPKNFLN